MNLRKSNYYAVIKQKMKKQNQKQKGKEEIFKNRNKKNNERIC